MHWSDRFWWTIGFGLSLGLCGSMIQNFWTQWNEDPFKLNIDGTADISSIPFPTITICPIMKALKSKLDISSKFNQNLEPIANLSDTELSQLDVLIQLYSVPTLELNEKMDKFTDDSIYNLIEEMAPNLTYTMHECRWQQKKINCVEYFIPMVTGAGLCFAFNALNSRDIYTDESASALINTKARSNLSNWSIETGYNGEYNGSEYPNRVPKSGREHGLDIVLSMNTRDHDAFCEGGNHGFQIGLNAPSDMELIESSLNYIKPFTDTKIIIKPTLFATLDGLGNYEPKQRNCYFKSERKLRFFKTYTQSNCNMECRANFTKQKCDCVKFSLPRDNDTEICGGASIDCYRTAWTESPNCNCLPSCKYTYYDLEMSSVKISDSEVKAMKSKMMGQEITRLSIYFDDQETMKIEKRINRYSLEDILAFCGGVLGLFLGVSLLSIIEIVYYFTLRLFWIIYRPRIGKVKAPLEKTTIGEIQRSKYWTVFRKRNASFSSSISDILQRLLLEV
ncbi:pickpocket protein 28-like [Contarinia nasturtii]|uniref:pickpocket protein 28-like n=1 Tax=Contarinia nasturtii TaxID=265458 RepID=UPI0012D3FAB8|nr:pickpocket protein 28-like [Contarinia nasturtii]